MTDRRILVVDDSPEDRASVRIAFEQSGFPIAVSCADGGRAALDLLRAAAADAGSARPHIMLVDIDMPGQSGLEFLAAVKKDKSLREIPVWMLSGSQNPGDVRAAYRANASGFLRKPDDLDGLRRLTELLARLCVEALEFPAGQA
jgi:CheY-like chemotaxis protein